MLQHIGGDTFAYHPSASSLKPQYELDRYHNIRTWIPVNTCTCCRCCSSCHSHYPEVPNLSCRTCSSSRFSTYSSVLDTDRIPYYASRMRHIPENDESQGPTTILSRQSRFHERFSSTHTPVPSLHDSPAIVSSTAPASTPIHIIRRLSLERRLRSCQHRCSPPWVARAKLYPKFKYNKQFGTPMSPSIEVHSDLLYTRSSSTVSIASSSRRRSLVLRNIHAHSQSRRMQKKREKKERKKQLAVFKGGMWGYSPSAGRLMTHEARHTTPQLEGETRVGCFIFRGAEKHSRGSDEDENEEIDEFGRRTGKTWV